MLSTPSAPYAANPHSWPLLWQIYPGSKIKHFERLRSSSGVAYTDMVFFDDEHRNAEVGTKLGVDFVLVEHNGTDIGTFTRGLLQWQAVRKQRKG